MKFQNLPPLNKIMLDHFRSQAAAVEDPGGSVAFHVDGVFFHAAVSVAGNVCRVLSWVLQGPMTREEVEAEIQQTAQKPVAIN